MVRVKLTLSTYLPMRPSPKSVTNVSENGMMILKCQFVKILQKQNYTINVNKKIHARTCITTVKSEDGSLVSLDDKKASLFNSVFQKVFINNNGVDPHTDCLLPSHKLRQDIEITTADVAKALHRLNTSMSWSPGSISAYFLKQVGFTLVHILTYLFNLYIKVLYQMSGNGPLLHLYIKRVLVISP